MYSDLSLAYSRKYSKLVTKEIYQMLIQPKYKIFQINAVICHRGTF